MRKSYFFAAAFTSVIAISCGSGSNETNTDSPSAGTPGSTQSIIPATPATVTNAATPQITAPDLNVPTQATTASSAAGMNPAHGQPGHRCDIAVGAPLNSAPATQPTTATTVAANPSITNQAPVIINKSQPVAALTTPATTAAGMNPAHGQPGHRCDIAVGAPLNSAPATTNNAAANLKPSITNTAPVITKTAPATATTVAPGMNPAHGQPGHRCDIAVGAPLNSAPATASTPSVVPAATNEAKKPVIQTQEPAKKEN